MKIFYSLLMTLFISNLLYSQTEHRDVSVYFDTNKYTLNSVQLEKIADFIADFNVEEITEILLFGYTDDRGSDAYNMNLSIKRAKNVKEQLLDLGVPKALFKVVKGKGESEFVIKKFNDVETDIVRGLNRKVTIDINTGIPKPDLSKTLITYKFRNGVEVGDRFVLENIHFQEGYAWIIKESFPHLKSLTALLKKHDNVYIEIHGHVCCTRFGRDAIDRKTRKQNLSYTRAKAVYDYLWRHGIKKNRMRFKGMRRNFPLGKGSEYDRRVEILIKHIATKKRR